MDLDFSFTLRTSIRPTVEKKLKTKPVSGQSKRVLSSTRRKNWHGLFVNDENDLQQSKNKSEKYIDARKSSAKQLIANIFCEELKENLDASCFVMNRDEKRSNLRQCKKNNSKQVNASSVTNNNSEQLNVSSATNHNSEQLNASSATNHNSEQLNVSSATNHNSEQVNASSATNHNSEQLNASSATNHNSEQLNASSATNHNSEQLNASNATSSGEKDFIELGKVSLRKHQRTLYKRNIKYGKLFYKRSVIQNFTEFIDKSFASNNSSESRKLSDDVIENGLRISEKYQVDRSALNVDEDEDEDDLFSGLLSSSSSRLEKPSQTNKNKSVLDDSISLSSSTLAQKHKDELVLDLEGKPGNGLDQSLIVSSPSLLSSSLLGCRPLSNRKKRPPDRFDDCRPKKRSFNTTENVFFKNLTTKVKSIMSSYEDFSSPSPKPPKSSTDSFIDCISASDSDEHDCSHLNGKSKISISSTRKSSRKHLTNGNSDEPECSHYIDSSGKSKISLSSTRKSSRKHLTNGNSDEPECSHYIDSSGKSKISLSSTRKSPRKQSNNKSRFDTKKLLKSSCVETKGNETTNGVEHKQIESNNRSKFETNHNTGCDRLKANDFHDKDVDNSSNTKQDFDINSKSLISTRSSRGKSSKHVLNPTEAANNVRTVDDSCTSVDMFDDSRLSEVRSVGNPVSDNNGDKLTSRHSRRSVRMNCDRGSVGLLLDSSLSNRVEGKKISDIEMSSVSSKVTVRNGVRGEKLSGVGILPEGPESGETKYADCVDNRGDLLGFCLVTSKTSERLPSHEILEKPCDSISQKQVEKQIETVNNPFTRPQTPRRRSCRISGVSNLRKDDSWVSRDMFESDVEDERPKSRLDSLREVDTDDGEIVIRNPDQIRFSISENVKIREDRISVSPGKRYADTPPRRSKGLKDRELTFPKDRESLITIKNCSVTDEVHYNISENVKTRTDRKSLTPVNTSTGKPARKSREKFECDPGYVTPSLPRTKLLEITKWLTDSEKSIRQIPPSTKHIPPPVIEEPIGEIIVGDSGSEGGDKVETPPKAKTDKHRANATDKQKTRNRTKTDKRSKKVKEESQDKDEASSRVKTISGTESKVIDNADKYRPVTANVGMYTEPKKPKKNKVDLIQASFTEKKPTKTSMFSSSSSSEDLFEKFLEDEKKKRLSKLKRLEKFEKLSTERFIYDGSSEEDENDLAFYNDFIGSEVKKDIDCLSEGKWSSHSAESSRSRHGHPRRLSFESQESGSDRAAIDNALKPKKPRVKPKKRTPDKISKKHLPFRISPKHFLGSINKKKKSSKKPTNSSKKTHEDKVIEQIKRINDNKKLQPATPTTEKSSTKKVPKTPLTVQKPASGVVATPSSAKLRKELFSKTPARTLSFLSSLSALDDSDCCHPDAVQYKNNFKKLKEELAKKLFALYNREVFKNRLPEDLPIEWNSRMRSTSGYCFNKRTIRGGEVTRSARIQLSSKILDSPDRLRDTLIHEMCHAATWLLDGVKDAHGATWKNWTLEAMHRFPELPRIKVCHDYKIKTKYSYKCLGCGYSVGRHSKSLDIEHKRCGYCYGKFELLVNVKETADKKGNNKKRTADKESDTATSTSTTRAVRAPTGFALFVKDNYARTKQENGQLAHKDVMKLLSEKFAQVKLTKAIKEDDEVILVES